MLAFIQSMLGWPRRARTGMIELFHTDHHGEVVEPPKEDKEHGSSGTEQDGFGFVKQVDYNVDWVGEEGVKNAEKMRKSDGSIRSVLQAMKLPLRRATWRVIPAADDGGDEKDKEIATFCHRHLIQSDDQHETWDVVLRHILLMLDFGFAVLEKVWTVNDAGELVLARLAPRLPQTIKDFKVNPDGTLKYVVQEAYKRGKLQELRIPAQYVAIFCYDKEGDNYWGTPLLRYLWQHYYYKQELYRIDAIKHDRLGVGLPIGYIQKGYVVKKNEKDEVVALLKGIRSHHRAFALLPEEIKVEILTAKTEGGGAAGLMDSVDHHDVMIARAVLALFLTAGSQRHGNYGTTVTWADLFLYSLQSLALQICQDLQMQVIRDLCNYNFDMAGRRYPKVEASTLEDTNVKEMAAAIYNLCLGQVLIPDDELEAHVRRLLAFPIKQEGYTREELGIKGAASGSPAINAPNLSGKPSPDDKEALNREPTPGTKPGTTPQRGPIRVPGEIS